MGRRRLVEEVKQQGLADKVVLEEMAMHDKHEKLTLQFRAQATAGESDASTGGLAQCPAHAPVQRVEVE